MPLNNDDSALIAIAVAVGCGCLAGAAVFHRTPNQDLSVLIGLGVALVLAPVAFMAVYKLR